MPETRTALWLVTFVAAMQLASGSAFAAVQAAGPVQVGPSWAQADPQASTAQLSTIITNNGPVADRLIRAECPASGHVALRNGTLHQDIAAPNASQQIRAQQAGVQQNGLDVPPALHGAVHPVTAQFDLTQANQPLADGALIPCTVTFAHAGERIVMFTVGESPQPTPEP